MAEQAKRAERTDEICEAKNCHEPRPQSLVMYTWAALILGVGACLFVPIRSQLRFVAVSSQRFKLRDQLRIHGNVGCGPYLA